jgi:hypothetical protein
MKRPEGAALGSIFLVGLGLAIVSVFGIPRPGREEGVSAAPFEIDVPEALRPYIGAIRSDRLGGRTPAVTATSESAGLYRLTFDFDLPGEVAQDDWRVEIRPAFPASFHWSPHLTPTAEHIVDQHSFRSPAVIASSSDRLVALIPDIEIMKAGTPVRWYLDVDAPAGLLTLGMGDYSIREPLLYVRKPGAKYPPGPVKAGFYLIVSSAGTDIENPWRKILAFLWDRWGRPLFETGHPLIPDLSPYIRHTYRWAFETWAKAIWQEFDFGGKRVGAPVFIVNETQSPNYPGEVSEREFRSIWNQAWFSSLRSASGLLRYARRIKDEDLARKALMTKELALAAPMRDGFFPALIATEMERVEIGGKAHNRSKGWATAFWGNSDRNPVNRPPGKPRSRDPKIAPYHILDMSWTSLLMLRWYEELEKDKRLFDYAKTYGEKLLTLQTPAGYFPAWLDLATLRPLGILDDSPETSMSVTFLLKLADLTGRTAFRDAAVKAMEAVARDIFPVGRWEDFETYWSSSPYGDPDLIGKKVVRNNMYKQCNFSIFWTAEALFETFKATGTRRYLELGRRVLDELLMTQASWQPPYLYVDVLGGFGVMNADGEWLDARQSLFAEIILRYGLELGVEEYIQRGLAALRASFVMMYCPENPRTKVQWEKRHPFFGPADYGFTMENYGHGGGTDPQGGGMGVFTIYDWGNGAAAEAYNRLLDHFGPELVHRKK